MSPKRIIAMATRNGAVWKAKPPDPWFGEEFRNVEYVRADLCPSPELLDRVRERIGILEMAPTFLQGTDLELLRAIIEECEK